MKTAIYRRNLELSSTELTRFFSCNESTVSDDENLSIVLHTERARPNGLHGEFGVDVMQAYEHENRVYIIARDGWRIRNETADSERLRNYRID